MNKNTEKIKSFASTELYVILFSVIKKIYKNYNYINISEDDYKNLVLLVIEKCQSEFTGEENIDFINYFSDKLIDELNNLVNKLLNDNNRFFNIVNSFVEKNVKKGQAYCDRLGEFMKLVQFFIDVDYYPDMEEYKELINKNEVVKYLLRSVVKRNIGAIKTNQLNKVFDSEVSINLIKDYCNINDIALYQEKANCGDDEFYNSFAVKMDEKEYTDNLLNLYFDETKFPLLSIDEERELAVRNANGDVRAREILIERNLRYVVSVAKEYHVSDEIDFLDIIQTGNIGLIKAVDNYDPSKECRLLTYADYHIRSEIDRFLAYAGYDFKIPYGEYEKVKKYKYAIATLKGKSKEENVAISEIAKKMNITEQEVSAIAFWTRFSKKYNALIRKEGNLESQVTSIEASTEEIIEKQCLQEQFREYILSLDFDDIKLSILKELWGIFDSEVKSAVELAKIYSLSRERIGQIEGALLKKIRKRVDVNAFASYMDNEEESLKRLNKYRELYCINSKGRKCTYLDSDFFESIGFKNRVAKKIYKISK